MKKFLVLYMAPVESFDTAMQMSEEDSKPVMDAWQKWMQENASALADGGAPVGKSKKITSAGAEDFRNTVGGYSVVQADSLDAAAALFGSEHPHFMMDGAWIEISECVDMPKA